MEGDWKKTCPAGRKYTFIFSFYVPEPTYLLPFVDIGPDEGLENYLTICQTPSSLDGQVLNSLISFNKNPFLGRI